MRTAPLRVRPLAALLIAASLAACGGAPDRAAEEEKLMETSRAWSRVAAGGDDEATLSYWADDAVVIQPGQEVTRGREPLRGMLASMRKIPGFRISWEPLEARVSESGDMGYLIERTSVTMNGPDGKPATQQYRAVTIWRKQADGSWKNVVDMSNEGPPAGPAASAPAAGP